jgi:phenylpropionate dioxygenase-like ring-hydroxylating dioxygenase large terminal subunit
MLRYRWSVGGATNPIMSGRTMMPSATQWVEVCEADEIDEEDVIRFDHQGRTFAVYRSPDGNFFATDGLCTHEQVHLADGLVLGVPVHSFETRLCA